MHNYQVIVIGICFIMAVHVPFVNGLPKLTTRHLASSRSPDRMISDNTCKNYMENCVPWETSCCNEMECMNLARGYCLYPLEKCLCQKVATSFY
uniref:Uncharacterized protein n=1 Tax=Arion vulgaris TaxID=1028688 RepID=A0A0B6ZFS8_9EUPU